MESEQIQFDEPEKSDQTASLGVNDINPKKRQLEEGTYNDTTAPKKIGNVTA